MKYYNYEDLSINSAKKPFNNRLWWVISSSLWFMVDFTNQLVLLKSIDKGANWATVTTRTHKIQAGWHDRTNGIIHLVDCDNDGTADDFDVWKITTDGNDTITSIGTSTGAVANSVYVEDIFVIGAKIYVLNKEIQIISPVYVIWDVTSAPFNEEDHRTPDDNNGITKMNAMPVIVVGTLAYFPSEDQKTGANLKYFEVFKFDSIIPSISYLTNGEIGWQLANDDKLLGTSYDGSDIIYFILEKQTDNKNYLMKYSITLDSFTQLGEYSVSLMLDRNTASGIMEKAFHLTELKVYQLHPNISHQLYLIAIINTSGTIVGVTDNYLIIDDSGTYSVWEYKDLSSYLMRVEFIHEIMNYSEGTLGVNRDEINVKKGDFMQILGTFTTDELDRLFKGTYNFKDEANGTEGLGIGFIDAKSGDDSTYSATIIASEDSHKKVVKFLCAGDNGKYARWDHDYDDQTADGTTFEFIFKYIDKGVGYHYFYLQGVGNFTLMYFMFNSVDNKLYYYYGNGAGGTTSSNVAAAADAWHHVRVSFDFTNDHYDIYLNGVLIGNDKPFYNDVLDTGITKTRIIFNTFAGTNSGEAYLDAWGESWDANYDVGDNLVVEGGETDQVIFEGIVVDFDGERRQKVWLESPAKKELLEKKPRGDFSGRSDEIITTLLSTYCKYMTKGTFSVGTAMGTVTYAGDKSLMTILIELALFEKWIWYLDPQGRLFFNDGTVDSLVDLSKTDKIFRVKTGKPREPYNYFYLKGAIVSGVQLVKELEEADDLVSQQLHGYNPYEKTFASFNTQSKINTLTTNVKARLKETPLVVDYWHYDASLGMIQNGETVTFVYDTTNINVLSDQFLINRVLFKGEQNVGGYTVADKLI